MDPASGRFTQQDSFAGFGRDPRSLHKYVYGNDEPVGNVDPSGHFSLGNLGASIAISGTLTAIANAGIFYMGSQFMGEDPDGQPAATIVTVSGSVGSGGAMAEAGADFILDKKSGKVWAYGFFGPGLSPLTLFKNFRRPGYTIAAGLVWNLNDPSDWSGSALGASLPWGVLHLLPSASFRSSKMWGAMTQLAKREKNVSRSDLSIQIGVSTSGPVALKVATRTNSFSAGVAWASDAVEVGDLSSLTGEIQALFRDAGKAEELVR